MNSDIEAILKYRSMGWPSVPVEKGTKRPLIKDWPHNASVDEEQLRAWNAQWPEANWAIVTGRRSSIAVIDVDPRNGGFESLNKLEADHGPLPATISSTTGGGGKHFYFKCEQELPKKTGIYPGIDLLADRAMAIVPPSVHQSGKSYTWDTEVLEQTALAPIPSWILDLVQTQTKINDDTNDSKLDAVIEGGRNEFLFKAGCSLRTKGLDETEIVAVLTAINTRKCNPPLDVNEVTSIAKSCARYSEVTTVSGNYRIEGGSFVAIRGEEKRFLSNFTAWIVSEVFVDNGQEQKLYFDIEGRLSNGTQLPRVRVLAEEFLGGSWIMSAWGAGAIVSAGFAVRDHLRAAIQELSSNRKTIKVFAHTGWREINGKHVFLTARGGLADTGLDPSVIVELPHGICRDYCLPDPPAGSDRITAIRASISVLDLGPSYLTYPLLLTVYLAVLGEILEAEFSVHLAASTGNFKSYIAGVILAHFGDSFSGNHLTASWDSTANFIQLLTFILKNVVSVIDDYCPKGTINDRSRLERESDRTLRGSANGLGRGRMTHDRQLAATYYSRSMILTTGEEPFSGTSLNARVLTLMYEGSQIDQALLTKLQEFASNGVLAQATSAFVQWVAPRLKTLEANVHKRKLDLRAQATKSGQHKRTPQIVATLAVAMEVFTDFAFENGAISSVERDQLRTRCWTALGEAADHQKQVLDIDNPGDRFLSLLRAGFVTQSFHLVDKAGATPSKWDMWGWKDVDDNPHPQGKKVGWVTDKEIWLEPDAIFTEIQRIASAQHQPIVISQDTLWRRLAECKIILTSDRDRRNTIKRNVGKARPRVIIISRALYEERTSISDPTSDKSPYGGEEDIVDLMKRKFMGPQKP